MGIAVGDIMSFQSKIKTYESSTSTQEVFFIFPEAVEK